MKNHSTPIKLFACATIMSTNICTMCAASPPSEPPVMDAVVLSGLLHVDDETRQVAVMRVEVNGVSQEALVADDGRFELMLPADADVRLRFELPDHAPKDVVIDTHHAQDGDFAHHQRRLEFAVVMELKQQLHGLTYAGPVGAIGFDPGGGCVAVSHNKKLVPAKRNAVMEF